MWQMLHKIKLPISIFAVFASLFLLLIPISVFAAPPVYGCPGGPVGPGAPASCPYTQEQVSGYCADPSSMPSGASVYCSNGGGVVLTDSTSQPASASTTPPAGSNTPTGANLRGDCKPGQGVDLDESNCGILAYLITGINILSALVGVVVVTMIAVGGIQYSLARDNPQATSAAKGRILNALIALVAYIFMWTFLQYIIPGGVL